MAERHVAALLWGRAEVGHYLQDGGESRDNIAMGTGGSRAFLPRRGRCYEERRKYRPISKMAPNDAVGLLWERAEVRPSPRWRRST